MSRPLLHAVSCAGLALSCSAPSLAQDPPPAAPVSPPAFDPLFVFEEIMRQSIIPPREPRAEGGSDAEEVPEDDAAAFVWSRSIAIEALVEIYRRRREDAYLERALRLSDELLAARDSVQRRRDPQRKTTLPAWSARSAYPARYAPVDAPDEPAERRGSPALTALAVACGMELVSQIQGEARLLKAHKRAVTALEAELRKALACFEEEYTHAPAGKEGYYFPPGERHVCLPSADLALLGRAHLALAGKKRGEDAERAEYLARFLKSRFVKGADGVTLRWAPLASPNGRGGQRERIFHAGLVADFVKRGAARDVVFVEADTKAIRETLAKLVIVATPRVPRFLEDLRPDQSSEMAGLEEALPWLWAATIDPSYRDFALATAQHLGVQAPAEGMILLAALVEPKAAVGGPKK